MRLLCIDHHDAAAVAPRGELQSVRRIGQRMDFPDHRAEAPHLGPCFHIPYPNRFVPGTARQSSAIGVERNRTDISLMPRQLRRNAVVLAIEKSDLPTAS